MAGTQRDSHISALEAVYGALKDLDLDTRRKVLASVYALLDMSPSVQTQQEQHQQPLHVEAQPTVFTPDLTTGGHSTRPVSIVELMQEKKPSTNLERLALFAYYRERVEGKSRFGRDDLQQYFGMAKEPPPKNYPRDFNETVRRGWIHEDGTESYITSKGIEAVEAGFPPEAKANKSKSRQRDKRGQTTSKSGKKPVNTKNSNSKKKAGAKK